MELRSGKFDLDCEPTCTNPSPMPGTGDCPAEAEWISACVCVAGFVWDGERCIDPSLCGCTDHHGSEFYVSRSVFYFE